MIFFIYLGVSEDYPVAGSTEPSAATPAAGSVVTPHHQYREVIAGGMVRTTRQMYTCNSPFLLQKSEQPSPTDMSARHNSNTPRVW